MDSEHVAEWMLSRAVDSERACEVVGDYLESHPSAGRPHFWLSMAWLMLVFSWRSIVGVLLSPVVGVLLTAIPVFTVYTLLGQHGYPQPPSSTPVVQYYLGVSLLLWGATTFSAVRFGLRSVLTRVSFGAALLGGAASCFFWMPHGVVGILTTAIFFFLLCISSAPRRKAFAVLSLMISSTWLVAHLMDKVPNHLHGSTLVWSFAVFTLLIFVLEGGVASFFHKRLLES
jgi:hypothetical protein